MRTLTRRLVFFVVIVLIVTGVPLVVFSYTNDFLLRFVIVAISIISLILGFRIAIHTRITDNRIRLLVVTTSAGIFGIVLHFKQQLFSEIGKRLVRLWNNTFNTDLPEAIFDVVSTDLVTGLVLVSTVAVAYFVLRSLSGTPPMGVPDHQIAEILPAVTNFDRLDNLKQTLRGLLDQTDQASRWHESSYVPLAAEVQVLEGRRTRRHIVDLLGALKSNQSSKIFVVLGDPGTGKSIAMRKLVRDLLMESGRSDRIPIYINLKEWRVDREWTPTCPPQVSDFHQFVFNNLLQSLDWSSRFFVQTNYQALLEAGYLFFVFDSFDEIPAVLDHDENSWLIEALSNCIVTYALGGTNARAIIASRLFRKPTVAHQLRSVLEIRPFSDDRIVQAIDRGADDPKLVKTIVLTKRSDLGSIARNPFLLHLIIAHFNAERTAPITQAQMFETYFKSNMNTARSAYGLQSIDDNQVFDVCEKVSQLMFSTPNVGLEIPEAELQAKINSRNLSAVISFLAQARIGRIGGISRAFSFSHRRFNEYFLVRRLMAEPELIPFNAIQSDSRWRDALVLYAEVASEPSALQLAKHSWNYAGRLEHLSLGSQRTEFVEARHSLRFLIEGFRSRTFTITEYHSKLASLIATKLQTESDYLEKKTVVEALGLIPFELSAPLILTALRDYPGWISEHAAGAARYLTRIDDQLADAIVDHCTQRPGLEGIKESMRQERVFAISDAFIQVARGLRHFRWDFYKSSLALALLVSCIVAQANIVAGFAFISSFFYLGIAGSIAAGVKSLDKSREWAKALTRSPLIRPVMQLHEWITRGGAVNYPPFILVWTLLATSYLALDASAPNPLVAKALGLPQSIPRADIAPLFVIALVGSLPLSPRLWRRLRLMVLRVFILKDFIWFIGALIGIGATLATFGLGAWLLLQLWIFIESIDPAVASMLKALADYAVIVVLAIIGITLVAPFVIYALRVASDYLSLKTTTRQFVPDRQRIAAAFLSLQTEWMRLRYVAWLERASLDHIVQMRSPSNVWPNGKRPQPNGDGAAVRLAQLDAVWLGLD